MNRNRIRFLLCFAGAFLMSGPALAQDRSHPPATCGSWEWVPSANPNGNGALVAVAAVPGTGELWAVGYYNANYHDQTLIEHWDGTNWQAVPSPNIAGADHYLLGVTALSSNDAWAVWRYEPSGGGERTLTLHWNGTSWSIVPSANAGIYNQLRAVAGDGVHNLWAIGFYYVSGRGQQTLVEQWDGQSWSIVPSPNVGLHDNLLTALTIVPSNSANVRLKTVWAVGYYYRDAGPPSTLIQRWDGTAWTVVPSPDGGPRENYLTGVSSSGPNDVWTVGQYNTPTGLYLPLTEHWDGQSWQVVPAPSESSSMTAPVAVSSAGPKDVWAVGSYYNANAAQLTLAQHWDGTNWQTFPSPSPAGDRNGAVSLLQGVVSVPGQGVWAVGLYYQPFTQPQTLIEFYCAGSQ